MENQIVIWGVRVDGVLTLISLIGYLLLPTEYLDELGYVFAVAGGGVILWALVSPLLGTGLLQAGGMIFAGMAYLLAAALLQKRFWENFTGDDRYPSNVKWGVLVIFAFGTAMGFLI